jgi:hypothetical protein
MISWQINTGKAAVRLWLFVMNKKSPTEVRA